MIEIKFIPTGNIFALPDDEAIRIVREDRGNYEVISGKIPEEKKPKEKKSVQELVVVGDDKGEGSKGDTDKDKNKTQEQNKNQNKQKNQNKKQEKTE